MPNDSQNVAGRLASRGLMARSLVRFSRGAAKVSLPGFAELGDMVKELVEDWKTADHNDNELTWLHTRLEDLCGLVREFDMAEHPNISDASRKFHELKGSLAEEFRRQSCSRIRGAEQEQRLLDSLNREIDRVVEMTLLRLALVQAQSNKPNPVDNFPVISAHEITDHIPVYGTMRRNRLVPSSENIPHPLVPDRPMIVSSWQARLGRVPVRYKTFSSRSNSGVAAKAAEEELKYLSRCLHPNIAKILGVTKGYDGINGYAVAEDGIPLDLFLLRVNSGAALIKFIRGVNDLHESMMGNFVYHFDSDHITVKRNGQFTMFPVLSQYGGSSRIGPYFSLSEDDRDALSPAIREFLAIYFQIMTRHRESLYEFYDSVMTLGWKSLTELEMARLAAKYRLLPNGHTHHWQGPNIPPYTANVGDIGYVLSQGRQGTWSPIELSKCAPGIQGRYECWCNRAQDRWTYMEGDRWTSTPVHICETCETSRVWWGSLDNFEVSYEWAKRVRASLHSDGVRVKGAQYCISVRCILRIYRTGTIEWPSERLYFHCNPSMRSDPQAFWGFLSTSADPCSPSIIPGELGLELTYVITCETYCLSDFWDHKYEEMLRSGLGSIPGSYPGSYIEEVSEDEVSEDETCVPPL